MPDAHGARGVDVGLVLGGERLAAHDPGEVEPGHGAEGREQQHDVAAEQDDQQDHQQDERQRVESVDHAHHGHVRGAAQIAGGRAPGNADQATDEGRGQGDDEGHAGPGEGAHEKIASDAVCAEPMNGAGAESMASQSTASKSQGDSHGPAVAASTTRARTAQHTRASGVPSRASRMADPRVEFRVAEIDQQIEAEHQRGVDDDGPR